MIIRGPSKSCESHKSQPKDTTSELLAQQRLHQRHTLSLVSLDGQPDDTFHQESCDN